MRYGYLFLLVTISSILHAKLYQSLKKPAYKPYVQSDDFSQVSALKPLHDPFLEQWNKHYVQKLLKRQFSLYNKNLESDYVVRDINVNEQMSGALRALTEDTVYTQIALISAVGVLVLLPESVSNWDLNELQKKSLGERWREHVTTKPVWDADSWVINYVGHPVFGAVYYTMARNDGMDIFESALFSTVMSTFFWEYGYEAFAEIPSIQDLIATPLVGSFIGEGLHTLEGQLDENEGKIWGFKALGSVSYFFLDPMGRIAGGLSNLLDVSVAMEFTTFSRYDDPSIFRHSNDQANPVRFQDRDYGFMLTFY